MEWMDKGQRKPGVLIALRRLELGLDQEDAAGQVRTTKVSAAQIGTGQVGHPEVGRAQVSAE